MNRTNPNRPSFLAHAAATTSAGWVLGTGLPAVRGAEDATKVASDADGDVYRVQIKLQTPKSGNDKRVPRPLESAPCSVFIPRGARALRGATLNPFYEPTVNQKHWRAAADLCGFAHIGINFFGVRKEEQGETVLRALKMLGEASGLPELLWQRGRMAPGTILHRRRWSWRRRTVNYTMPAAAKRCIQTSPSNFTVTPAPLLAQFRKRGISCPG